MRERFSAAGGAARIIGGLGLLVVSGMAFIAAAPAADARDIFQVEFRDCVVLHVGYRDFPAGAVVNFVVHQNSQLVDRGQFVASGGNHYHFVNLRLRNRLSPTSKGVVTFNGVFTAQRKPGCIRNPPTSIVPITVAGSTTTTAAGAPTTAATPATALAAGGQQQRGPLAFTGSSNLPASMVGLAVLVCGGALIALGLRGPLSRRKLPGHVMPPWLHVPVPSGRRRGGGGGGRSSRSTTKNKLPPWLHTGVPSRRRR